MENKERGGLKKIWKKILFIFLTILLIFFIAIVFYFIDSVKRAKTDIVDKNLKLSDTIYKAEGDGNNYWIGSANPKVTIVEFGDFACPYCKNSYPKIREISIKYKKEVKIIFRDYPTHDFSLELSLAARCAGEQGLFWLMHDKLYQNQGINTFEQLTALANSIGADTKKFTDCFNSQKYLPQIQKDFTDAENFAISGTPAWFINGHKVEGDMPYNTFIQIIEGLLK